MKQFFFWAFLYQLVHGICGIVQQQFALSGWVTAMGVALYLTLLVIHSFHTGKAQTLGLTPCAVPKGWDLYFSLLLFMPALLNLRFGEHTPVSLATAIILVCAALTEELLFRGFALSAFSVSAPKKGILYSTVLFAVMHGANLFQGASAPDVLLQCLFAFFAGICYSLVTLRTGSLIPCALAHCLTNLIGMSLPTEASRPLYAIGIIIFAVGAAGYMVHLRNADNKEELS